ncbi:hypothetical protein J6590_042488 [Homalodisca vitripennis]|nr:hypothetical protein J6590_042488 [Homalodisca vitripennis]
MASCLYVTTNELNSIPVDEAQDVLVGKPRDRREREEKGVPHTGSSKAETLAKDALPERHSAESRPSLNVTTPVGRRRKSSLVRYPRPCLVKMLLFTFYSSSFSDFFLPLWRESYQRWDGVYTPTCHRANIQESIPRTISDLLALPVQSTVTSLRPYKGCREAMRRSQNRQPAVPECRSWTSALRIDSNYGKPGKNATHGYKSDKRLSIPSQ